MYPPDPDEHEGRGLVVGLLLVLPFWLLVAVLVHLLLR